MPVVSAARESAEHETESVGRLRATAKAKTTIAHHCIEGFLFPAFWPPLFPHPMGCNSWSLLAPAQHAVEDGLVRRRTPGLVQDVVHQQLLAVVHAIQSSEGRRKFHPKRRLSIVQLSLRGTPPGREVRRRLEA